MIKIIKTYLQSAINEKKDYFFNCLWDFCAVIFSTSLVCFIWIIAIKLLSILDFKTVAQRMIVFNKYFVITLALWGFISFIYLIVYYLKLIFSINKVMKEKLDEEISGLQN